MSLEAPGAYAAIEPAPAVGEHAALDDVPSLDVLIGRPFEHRGIWGPARIPASAS